MLSLYHICPPAFNRFDSPSLTQEEPTRFGRLPFFCFPAQHPQTGPRVIALWSSITSNCLALISLRAGCLLTSAMIGPSR